MAVYAVGDLQGCYRPLRALLAKIHFHPNRDVLWCVGDLLNRGPDSLSVLRYLRDLGDAAVCVLGNHDLYVLARAADEAALRRDTVAELLAAPDVDELIDWLRYRPIMHRDRALSWSMVHAGLHPQWSLKKHEHKAERIQQALRSSDWQDFCRYLHRCRFAHQQPKNDKMTALAFATAVFTRSRFCTQEGVFSWTAGLAEQALADEKPWFAHDSKAWSGKDRVVYGHWAAMGLMQSPQVLGLDSGCVWGGRLTAARLDMSVPQLFSVACQACQSISS